jgi:hypothetical protein
MEIRQARADELPYLQARLAETEHEEISLDLARVFVAVEGETILGVLPLRLIWQAEPLYVLPEVSNCMTRRRVTRSLLKGAEAWLADRSQNRTGIHWYFAIIRKRAAMLAAPKMGLWRIYKGAAHFVKYLNPE